MNKLYLNILLSLFIFAGINTQAMSAQKIQVPEVHASAVPATSSVFSKIKNFGKNIRFAALAKLNMLSPEHCIEHAERMVSDIASDDLTAKDVMIDDALIVRLFCRFGAHFQLVHICNELDRFLSSLKNMHVSLMNTKQKIAANVTKYVGLSEKCESLLQKITDLIVVVEQRKKNIVSNPDYKIQETSYILKNQRAVKDFWVNFIVRVGFAAAISVFEYYYNFGGNKNRGGNNGPSSEDIAQCKKLFGVSADATLGEIKKEFRKLSKIWHPDICEKNGMKKEDCGARMTEINGCYEMLILSLNNNRETKTRALNLA